MVRSSSLVLNVSLRDLAPGILLDAVNIVDDVEHCLKADTSPHLVEQLTGNRDFLDGTTRRRTQRPGAHTVRPHRGVLTIRPRSA
jgi:hypothetical protein